MRNDHGLDIRIHRRGIGREHIPRLEQPTPPQVGPHKNSHIPHHRNVPWQRPAGDCDQVKQYEDADRTLPEAMVSRISALRFSLRNSFLRGGNLRVASSVLRAIPGHIRAVSGLVHCIHTTKKRPFPLAQCSRMLVWPDSRKRWTAAMVCRSTAKGHGTPASLHHGRAIFPPENSALTFGFFFPNVPLTGDAGAVSLPVHTAQPNWSWLFQQEKPHFAILCCTY
jgi:hypothetical protein